MEALERTFTERLDEIEDYLNLLALIEAQVQNGTPRIGGGSGAAISTTQRRIMYSSVYLQLYNLVEATITKCVDALTAAIISGQWCPADLSPELRKEWVRYLAKTNKDLSYDNRLNLSVKMFEHLIASLPVSHLKIDKGGGGNWNDNEIHNFVTKRLGCTLQISQVAYTAIKHELRDKLGALGLIVKLRNDLAHGSVSFGECGDNVTVAELRDLKERTALYLKDVVFSFKEFITNSIYLQQSSRPQVAA